MSSGLVVSLILIRDLFELVFTSLGCSLSFDFGIKSPRDLKTITPCRAVRGYQLKNVMTDILEKRLIEALERVEAHGDVAPVHVHDPMTMLLRENAIQAHLMRWGA